MHHREPTIWSTKSTGARWRQTETTHIDRHLVKYNRKSGKQTAVQRGHNVFLLFFFISPFRKKSSVLFDIRPTCSSDEHKSGVECVWEPSPIVCSALSDPRVHVDTHSLSCLSLSVIKQRAVARLYERAVPFSTSPTHAGQNTPIFRTTRSQSERGHT